MKKKTYVKFVNWLLIAALAVAFISGILLHPFSEILIIKIIHKLSSVVLIIGVIAHILQHRK